MTPINIVRLETRHYDDSCDEVENIMVHFSLFLCYCCQCPIFSTVQESESQVVKFYRNFMNAELSRTSQLAEITEAAVEGDLLTCGLVCSSRGTCGGVYLDQKDKLCKEVKKVFLSTEKMFDVQSVSPVDVSPGGVCPGRE